MFVQDDDADSDSVTYPMVSHTVTHDTNVSITSYESSYIYRISCFCLCSFFSVLLVISHYFFTFFIILLYSSLFFIFFSSFFPFFYFLFFCSIFQIYDDESDGEEFLHIKKGWDSRESGAGTGKGVRESGHNTVDDNVCKRITL